MLGLPSPEEQAEQVPALALPPAALPRSRSPAPPAARPSFSLCQVRSRGSNCFPGPGHPKQAGHRNRLIQPWLYPTACTSPLWPCPLLAAQDRGALPPPAARPSFSLCQIPKIMEKETSVQESSSSCEVPKAEEPPAGADSTSPCRFFTEGRCRFGDRCRNLHPGSSQENTRPLPPKSLKEEGASEPCRKKPPMKTAEDVISRIQWDEHLPKDCFVVGYLDRFLGIIEKPFAAFSWEDLASVGYDVLAIPKHRIQYFKYRDLIVWDKSTRTDNVFGSTGSGWTIQDIMEKYSTLVQLEESMDLAQASNRQEPEDAAEELREEGGGEHTDGLYLEQPSTLAITEHPSLPKERPSHFVAVRINSKELQHAIKDVQDELLKARPGLVDFCSSGSTLHLTLCLLHLDSPEEIQQALTILQEFGSNSQRLLPPTLILHFKGLKDFHSRVLYVAPSDTTVLLRLMRVLTHSFSEKGLAVIHPPNSDSFHVTIAKVPKHRAQKDPTLQLCPDFYKEWQWREFGSQTVDALCFCCARGDRRSDGFYTTLLELPL
ncbi:leukocyte receptor cluster member 9 [Rhinatrema bivittatum]|uniref:leukocyte receptor cluster member 9 n=1 Tax=Rhinatrema bivittatum TaxID=194408 RepID=UPI00112898B1|nr:leukocyte receptor cluster member 9 [Rhinatrema bivittatum]